MRFLKLAVTNYGVFDGHHEFDLTPDLAKGRRISAISGHNGAGKTTLFQAIPFALHGLLSLGDRISQRTYEAHLRESLHRSADHGVISDKAKVVVTLEYVQSGKPFMLEVTRGWQRNGDSVLETLEVFKDGQAIPTNDPQAWLSDLIPPDLIPICFFDAEELAALVHTDKRDELLRQTLRRLLGLHLTERLKGDLQHYTLKQGGGQDVQSLKKTMLTEQSLLESLDDRLSEFGRALRAKVQEEQGAHNDLSKGERRLQAEGGAYAEQRPRLQKALEEVDSTVNHLSERLRELSSELLPFALTPQLNIQLERQLEVEVEVRQAEAIDDLWGERVQEVITKVASSTFWVDLGDISTEVPEAVSKKLRDLLTTPTPYAHALSEEPLRHDLSTSERAQLMSWITQAAHLLPQQATELGDRLRNSRQQREDLRLELQSAPADEALAPIYEVITALQVKVDEINREQAELEKEIIKVEAERDQQHRVYERSRKAFEDAIKGERGTDLAARSQKVLRAYQDALVRQKVAVLEQRLVTSFNAVCRKEHLLVSASINPNTFKTELRGKGDRVVALGDFSAGERQLYILSLLHALRQLTPFQLPLFIDTPFARLDETHRQRLLEHYFPNVSEQITLFATDAELKVLTEPAPHSQLARIYRLENDAREGATRVSHDSLNQPLEKELAYGA